MPQLPEDIIDRLTQMERRIQQLSTAVNSLPPLNKGSGGGGYVSVRSPKDEATGAGGVEVFRVGKWSGSEFGLAIRRQTGKFALSMYNGDGTSTSQQPLRIYDPNGREIFSDDIDTGGLARPWLPLVPPADTAKERWPQTTSTDWSTIARCWNPLWQPRMRMYLSTAVSSGATGEIQVLVNDVKWGTTVTAPTAFDFTGAVVSDFNAHFSQLFKIEIQARVTSASGTVYAVPRIVHGLQTS